MDAFFASVEQRDNPELRGKPVAVGGVKERGVVAAASYEARTFGVHSAMPSVTARRKCPELIFVKPRFEVYKEVSNQIREIFFQYTDLVEPLSLDEAYLDVTENFVQNPSATLIAKEIKVKIKEKTGLTASAGISFNKFLAKTATDLQKPDGLTLITPDKAAAILDALPIGKFYGIGQVTAAKMKGMGISNGADLKLLSEQELRRNFGKAGSYFYHIVRAEDDRQVQPNRIRKSIGAERTFFTDLEDVKEMLEKLLYLAKEVAADLHRLHTVARTVTLKIKYTDFTINTRSKTFLSALQHEDQLYQVAKQLLLTPALPTQPVRLLGISVSGLQDVDEGKFTGQLCLDFNQ
ncbi:MAG: DNA polymerase IV [Hymenobacteraceae bacterium]|nr:DNA polymerase IV [Hymenobacteraceae bacterium]MDX5396665.1 DNA polymerase IV [Hymenobacteraceae bacterium]MDX5442768.1 DNA polymerase IV [Hymenobacteraceae bacterium]MDX5512728.1 DNA polymerase IV [Hymenobacteraceae bacterium]